MNQIDRRRHPRFLVSPMYTETTVRMMDEDKFRREGHVYDVSEGGIQFELDTPIAPGTTIAMQISLPSPPITADEVDGIGRAIFVVGNVVWCDCEEPGPARMALVITRYCRNGDRERLLKRLSKGQYQRAA